MASSRPADPRDPLDQGGVFDHALVATRRVWAGLGRVTGWSAQQLARRLVAYGAFLCAVGLVAGLARAPWTAGWLVLVAVHAAAGAGMWRGVRRLLAELATPTTGPGTRAVSPEDRLRELREQSSHQFGLTTQCSVLLGVGVVALGLRSVDVWVLWAGLSAQCAAGAAALLAAWSGVGPGSSILSVLRERTGRSRRAAGA